MNPLPSPLLSALLFVGWLLLAGTPTAGHFVLAAALAVALPLAFDPVLRPFPRLRRPWRIVRLGLVVLRDIVVSNVEVARRILGPESALSPGFVRVPIALTDPYAISTLAGIITMTPGTLTCAVAPDGRSLLVHALDVADADALVATIKSRYEIPLMEIFA